MIVIPAPEPVAFNLFNIPVYWYGIFMAFAIFVSIIVANMLLNSSFKKDIILSVSPLIIIAGIAGARLYFCLLNPAYYLANPIEILDIRQGGLSIHGALIFGISVLFITAKKYKISFWRLLDAMGTATILGQFIGRWGNYFNSEAYGLPVSGQNWGLFIPLERRIAEFSQFSLFHPTFLYEGILDLAGFFVLLFIYFKFGRKYFGLTFFAYLTIYSVIRFFIEQIRVDSALNVASIPIALIVSAVMFFAGVLGIIITIIKNRK